MKFLKRFGAAALGLLGLGASANAAAIEIPQASLDELQQSITNVGGSAVTVWISIAVVVLGLIVLKKVFR